MNYYNDHIGALFGDKHTYRDYGIYPVGRFNMIPPEIKDRYIEIPGSDGSLDMTEALTGMVNYGNRQYEQTYKIVGGREKWSDTYSALLNDVHGKRMNVIFDEDEAYYYTGRLEISDFNAEEKNAYITIKGTFDPYKYEIYSSIEDWLWDPFNFESGVIREYANIEIGSNTQLEVYGTNKLVYPVINLKEGTATITNFNGEYENIALASGRHTYPAIALKNGKNTMTLSGAGGVIDIEIRGVSL